MCLNRVPLKKISLYDSLFQEVLKVILNAHHVHGAVSIPQEPPKKISRVLGQFCGGAAIFCVYTGNSKKMQIDFTLLPQMRAKIVRWKIFLCIFREFPL